MAERLADLMVSSVRCAALQSSLKLIVDNLIVLIDQHVEDEHHNRNPCAAAHCNEVEKRRRVDEDFKRLLARKEITAKRSKSVYESNKHFRTPIIPKNVFQSKINFLGMARYNT